MSAPGSKARAAGLTIMLISASAGVHLDVGGFGLPLLCFMGILVGASLVAAGVRRMEPPIVPAVFGGARAVVAAFVRRNTAALGLVMASCAVTVLSGEEGPVLCCCSGSA